MAKSIYEQLTGVFLCLTFLIHLKVSPETANSRYHCKIHKNSKCYSLLPIPQLKRGNLFQHPQALSGTAKPGQRRGQGHLCTEEIQQEGRGIRETSMAEERPKASAEMTGRGEKRKRTSATCDGLRLRSAQF